MYVCLCMGCLGWSFCAFNLLYAVPTFARIQSAFAASSTQLCETPIGKAGKGRRREFVCYWDVFYCESALKRFSTDLDWLFCGFAFLGSGLLNVYIYLHVCMLICKYIPIYIYIVSCWNAGAYLVCLDWICFSLQLHTLTSLYVVFTHISIYVNVYAYLCFCT